MKANSFLLLRSTKPGFLVLLFSLLSSLVSAQYIAVTDFQVTDKGNNSWEFRPLCKNGMACKVEELNMHLYRWEFGDGDYSFEAVPTHVFHNAGTFKAKLSVTNIYEDIDRKREAPPTKLTTTTFGPKNIVVAATVPYPIPYKAVPALSANAIVKKGYPVSYEYQLTNQSSIPLTVTEILARDPRQFWVKAGALPYTAYYDPSVFTNFFFNGADSTLVVKGTIPAYATASVVITYNASTAQDGTDLWARLTNSGCNSFICDSNIVTTFYNRSGTAWDPNSIQAFPERLAIAGEDLTYIIRFENKGDAAAENITIVDTLPNILDISSFKPLDSSHPEYLDTVIVDGRVVTWVFKEIFLPSDNGIDAFSRNEGWVAYRVNVNPNAYTRTFIENWAWITFDKNAPITTNWAVNRVINEKCEPTVAYRTLGFTIFLLLLIVVILLWVIARYRLRNPSPFPQQQQQSSSGPVPPEEAH
jgi:uncharacterized repeat protein (TIGR01451 family)